MDDVEADTVLVLQLVRVVHAGEHRADDVEDLATGKLPLGTRREDLIERLPVQEIHREEGLAVDLARLVSADDVRVIEPEREARLVLEHRPMLGVVGEIGLQPLHDDGRVVGRRVVGREVDVGHATPPELHDERELPEPTLSALGQADQA